MNPGPDNNSAPVSRHATRDVVFIQFLLGLGLHFFLGLPFLRRTHGRDRLRRDQKHLFVVNHISLLDTLVLATLCWRSGCYPILVLGDKKVWHASWIRKFLSNRTAFLLERGKLNPNRISELEEFGRAGREFQLIVFPEGTRGDGVNVATCQPGVYHIAQAARLPIVPVFIARRNCWLTPVMKLVIRAWCSRVINETMSLVSTTYFEVSNFDARFVRFCV